MENKKVNYFLFIQNLFFTNNSRNNRTFSPYFKK